MSENNCTIKGLKGVKSQANVAALTMNKGKKEVRGGGQFYTNSGSYGETGRAFSPLCSVSQCMKASCLSLSYFV